MTRTKTLLFALALGVQVPLASAKITYAVGTCEPKFPSYPTISAAVGATPPPNVVEVCPGTYNEQVVITTAMTVEGISLNNSTQAIIAVPSGGLVNNTGEGAVQLLVQNVSGEVNVSNLTVDAAGNNTGLPIGVMFQNSSGTMSHLTVQNQSGSGFGIGVFLEGGSANPSVTLENSNVQAFDYEGIAVGTFPGPSVLTATVKGNFVGPGTGSNFPTGIILQPGTTPFISGNLITGGSIGSTGISINDTEGGSISKNTIVSEVFYGIVVLSGNTPVSSNIIYNSTYASYSNYGDGLAVWSSVPSVTGNTIVAVGTGIDLICRASANVHSNTIQDAPGGLWDVPFGDPANTFYSVGTIRGTEYVGGCD
jgi:hypothetical protein